MSAVRDSEALLAFAREVACAPATMLLAAFRHGVQAQGKTGGKTAFDPVSVADREAEALMRRLIEKRHPEHGIIGEELGAQGEGRDFVWLLDPIDGTRAFIAGLPTFTTLVALLHEGRPLIGAIHAPAIGMTVAGDGVQCWRWWQGTREAVRTRGTQTLSEAFAGTTLPRLYEKDASRQCILRQVQACARHVQFDGDALFYAQVAAGRMDVALDTMLAPYDAAALVPIVRGAGGRISDWQGAEPDMAADSIDIVASASPALHEEMLALIDDCRAG